MEIVSAATVVGVRVFVGEGSTVDVLVAVGGRVEVGVEAGEDANDFDVEAGEDANDFGVGTGEVANEDFGSDVGEDVGADIGAGSGEDVSAGSGRGVNCDPRGNRSLHLSGTGGEGKS